MGYICGVTRPLSSMWLHELSPNSVRPSSSATWGLFGKIASTSFYLLSNFDDGQQYIWKYIFCIQIVPSTIFIILSLTYFKNIDSVNYYMSRGNISQAKNMLESYLQIEQADFILKDYVKTQQKQDEFLKPEKGSFLSHFKMIYNNYFHEFIYATVFSLIFVLTSKTSYWSFLQLFCLKNKDSQKDKKMVVFLTSLTRITMLISVSISIKYKVNKYRKTSYVIG